MQVQSQVKPKSQLKWALLLAILLIVGGETVAQNAYTLTINQEFKVSGTSTLHDWDMVSDDATGEGQITIENQKITRINSLVVTLPTKSLKSGKGSMDDNAYEALVAKEYPEIQFELIEIETITDQSLRAKGNLTIAGTKSLVPLQVDYEITGNTVQFSGSFPITFTQFNIEPPKALLGTIKTGDKLQISFETTFKLIN
uniref:YceI family protein n=1 Tax=Roseihalotalea indica TaxID=2867963 RepID=A0AA49GNL4_9BACT|nr:YceI family protein [Tunicatimonas sp. TK19036]